MNNFEKFMLPQDINSQRALKHLYPGTNILVNKLNESNSRELDRKEILLTAARQNELSDGTVKIKQTFDHKHIAAIHKYLFQDVYDWAGEFRDVDIYKNNSPFFPQKFIKPGLKHISSWLKRKSGLLTPKINDEQFIKSSTNLLFELNKVHPFREGNGRTQRTFIDDVAARSNRAFNWDYVHGDEMNKRCHMAQTQNNRALMIPLIEKALVENPMPAPPSFKLGQQKDGPSLSDKPSSRDIEPEL